MFTRDEKTTTAPVTPVTPEPSTPPRPQEQRAPAPARASSETSLISSALKVTGQLESDEDIQIEGQVEGDIRARKVMIGVKASVKGTVFGDDVDLAGTVNGKIEAKTVVLAKTARMSGDIVHEILQVDKGAFIDGHCRPHGHGEQRTGQVTTLTPKAAEKAASSQRS